MIRFIILVTVAFICCGIYVTYKPRVVSYIENKKVEFKQSYNENSIKSVDNDDDKNNSKPVNIINTAKNIKNSVDTINSYVKKYNDFKESIADKLKEMYEKFTNK